ncbi:AcvB/VirJ family lysyl-phosphatidylglycerol hydrolase [Pedobacter aquatilis]|uniref:AcvB/VirJ family lysyl-phosphatidylglycerol hydrolase n=1 Tax=Pedobacter aquatilis TaxID=351343 RepID=UPI00292E3BB7|nr:AcvB/VirJ family lysyl-phosphatidylglycerol hydrolase [Pedobacter aquatilis]
MFKSSATLTLLFLSIFTYAQNAADISKLPLSTLNKPAAKRIIFYFTGDGGLNSFSQKLISGLAAKNYAIVALDTRKYFWEQKSPDKFAQDMNELVQYYLKLWNKEEFSILGYSFGADAALFFVPRIKEQQHSLKTTVLLSPSTSTDLVVKVSDLIGFGSKEGKYKTISELNKINSPVLCIFGKDEDSDFYKSMKEKKNVEKALIPGSHKFDNDFDKIVSTVISGL